MNSNQNTRVPITPGMMETLRLPTDAQLSPDGQHVVYVVMEPVSDQPQRQGRIWIVDTIGGEPRPLTKGPGHDTSREGHGLVEREHRKDCEERILRWLKMYL